MHQGTYKERRYVFQQGRASSEKLPLVEDGATHLGDVREVRPYGPAGLPRLVYAEQLALQPDEGHLFVQPSPGTILQPCTDISRVQHLLGGPSSSHDDRTQVMAG